MGGLNGPCAGALYPTADLLSALIVLKGLYLREVGRGDSLGRTGERARAGGGALSC